MAKGYDLDGLICKDPELTKWDRFMLRIVPKWWAKRIGMKKVIMYRPKSTAIFITGRPIQERLWTEEWLDKNGMKQRILFLPYTETSFEKIIRFKAEAIKAYRIKKYYESDPKIAEALRKLVKDFCKVKTFNQKRWALV